MKKLVSLLLMLVFVFSLSCAMAEGKKHVENLIVGTTAANNTFNMTTQSDAFGRMNYNGLTQGNYVYRDANGDIIGFDIDLATEVCSRLGVKLKLQPINWDSKEMELNGKTIDCIWNGMSITDERINGMDLSTPYIANKQIIIVKSDSGISTKADLAGKTVGAQQGSSAVDAISAEPDVKASFGSLNEYASNDEAFLDLKAGRIDVLVVDEVYGRYMISQDK